MSSNRGTTTKGQREPSARNPAFPAIQTRPAPNLSSSSSTARAPEEQRPSTAISETPTTAAVWGSPVDAARSTAEDRKVASRPGTKLGSEDVSSWVSAEEGPWARAVDPSSEDAEKCDANLDLEPTSGGQDDSQSGYPSSSEPTTGKKEGDDDSSDDSGSKVHKA